MKNIDELVSTYQETRDEILFSEIYGYLEKKFLKNKAYESTIARSINASNHEIREIFDDCVMYTISKCKTGQAFIPFFKWKFKNKRANFIRDNKNAIFYESIDDDKSESGLVPIQIPDDFNLENHVINKKEADQLALIDYLSKNTDAKTTAIIKAFPRYDSVNALGKALGIHHETIRRKLRKLANNHNELAFGDYRDYLLA